MPRTALIIFDCDGVLVDSEPIAARVLAGAVRDLGLDLTVDEIIERFTGVSLKTVLAGIEKDLGRPLPDDFADRLRERDTAAFRRELRAIAGIEGAVASLPMARSVASSGSIAKMRLTLGLTGLLTLFEPHLFSSHQVALGKPAPDLFLYAAARMGVDPTRCVVVEDAVAGVRAAAAAGMRCLGFTGGGHCSSAHAARLTAAGADQVFSDMRQLPSLVLPAA
jgi:HAD superfamily hydrolase (TIGR01509 family)